ncbi:unnamed protein product [Blepharisma stoltei]|uniref:Transposase n=1 Tax=Blepharisma stoltei TaxID=1481888 RepID=A0AAU9KB44_9CILI|nr:unnamed protein product [Blepharisma stoltei]
MNEQPIINSLQLNISIQFLSYQSIGTGRFKTNNIENLWSRIKRLRAYINGFHPRNEKELENYPYIFNDS